MKLHFRSSLQIVSLIVLTLVPSFGCRTEAPTVGPLVFPAGWAFPAEVEPVRADNGMVVATDAYASQVGVDTLKAGGNAVDAAVATGFALAVTNPEAGNIGGGGFMVIRMAGGEVAALDYREKAPLAATRDMYLDEEGNLTDKALVGHLASGVPGSVMGLWVAHQRFGKLPWGDLVAPAIELAGRLEVTERFRNQFVEEIDYLSRFETSRETFIPDGQPPELGSTFEQPELAETLGRIRDRGPEGFYRGRTAELILEEMERRGGIITRADLESYTAAWREPIRILYRDYTIISMSPSSSGGATVAEAANILEDYDLGTLGWHSPQSIHLFAEAFKRAFADRNEYLGDSDLVKMPLAEMISKSYADQRGADISLEHATPASEVGPGLGPVQRGESTTHYSVVDREGSAVAVTTTINSSFGSAVTVTGAGFLLNNEMDDFAAKPGTPNQFGLVQGENNAVEPGKRMLSAMTPSIVLDPQGELLMVAGGPGGPRIITSVFETISNVVDHGMNLAMAVSAPRVHHQHLPDAIIYEPGGLTPEVLAETEALGHELSERAGFSGDVQAIMVMPEGTLEGASDPRRGGKSVGY